MAMEFIRSLIYLNGKIDADQQFLILFLIPVQGSYLIWVLLLLDWHNGQDIKAEFLLITITHLFYYLKEIVPKLPMAKTICNLPTPAIFHSIVRRFKLDERPFDFEMN